MSAADEPTGAAGGGAFRVPGRIRILPLAPETPSQALLATLAADLRDRLGTRVEVEGPEEADESWWTEHRSQLVSNAIVDSLIERHPLVTDARDEDCAAEWILGATAADLRGGSRDFVFGEAALGGAWAVISTARFGAEGSPRLRRRLLAEALHELGHLAGLEHCDRPGCLMTPAVDVADVDRRGLVLCVGCSLGPRTVADGP